MAAPGLGQPKKKARRVGAEIVFVDECGSSFGEPPATTWAPRGRTPLLRRVGYFKRVLSTFVGLTVSGHLYTQHFEQAMGGEETVQGLQYLRQQLGGPWFLVWDRSKPHLSRVVKAYLARHPEIQVVWLPTYSPELNPEEYCHGWVKQQLKNMVPQTVAELRRLVDTYFRKLRHRPELLLGYIHHAGLALRRLTNFRISQ